MSDHLDYEINKELGECYLFMGDMDKAEEYYRKAANSNGVHPDPYLGLATIAVQRGELDSALENYRKAATIEPTDKACAGMALVEMELGQHDQALEHFEQALRHNPENLIAVFGLVQAGHASSNLERVVRTLQSVLEALPGKHDVRFTMAGCLVALGRNREAARHLKLILEQDPGNAQARELYNQLQIAA